MPDCSHVPASLRPSQLHVAYAKFPYRRPALDNRACAMLLKRLASAPPESLCKLHIST
jgi:hypothetical protein